MTGRAPTLSLDPFSDAFLADPYAYHEAIREAGPVVWLEAIDAFGMGRFCEVQAALRDHRAYCSGRGVGLADFSKEEPFRPPSLLLEADPPLHDRTRSVMNRIVNLRALRDLKPKWQAIADELVARLAAAGEFDAVADLAEVFPMLVFPDTIGLPKQGREHLLTYAATVFNAFGPRNAIFEDGIRGKDTAFAWVAEACKRENLCPDGWGMAVYEAADRGECSVDEAERLVRSFLTAGVDTTVNGIAHMVLAFAKFPAEFQEFRATPHLAVKAFEESLRWDSSVQTFFRTTTTPVTVGDVTMPEGSKVLLFLASANRDPRQWDNPEAFSLKRNASGHVGFGFGIHQCLGQMVARLEAEAVAVALARHVASIRLTSPPTRRLNNTMHALQSLPVEVGLAQGR